MIMIDQHLYLKGIPAADEMRVMDIGVQLGWSPAGPYARIEDSDALMGLVTTVVMPS